MKLIVGLGNPGESYKLTRHNIGFLVIDRILKKLNISFDKSKFEGKYAIIDDLIIAKPDTYMNNSGQFVAAISRFYKIQPSDILVIHDEKDFEIGQAQIKIGGSSAGHNGVENVRVQLNSNEFKKLRIGIGKDPVIPLKEYVLSKFEIRELEILENVIEISAEASLSFAYNDIKVVMEKFNVNKKKKNNISS
ncbi:Peptidyl-tRNA hydrolase [Mycoplasmopsis meleagridis]|uniref:Peptidyl-tRNA hydrolase n=1 Tax=Mycoplasmopsis meleagridis ATCC 25294 TaxID=1264554 RepID=A0A0F5H052_9BACT|nr:aminoacyl-tRNA hydrolase [Mycoplasmopsis meleagridis]KKB26696.1 Peptidyl-tRNA hydrolase [Mycoplasmopsis meleagridis ATCC 25294]OAD18188.1 Peptidyl-tRNA hydrolase [Mycoplasmopsis meleagridis]VEU77751.1 aminoacyl-tRNA hydrolase [Mycoplasmopsis meleagridis]